MKCVRARVQRDEQGAALILAIAFMVVMGTISAALLSSVTSGLDSRVALDKARNREYAAESLVDYAIANARAKVVTWDPTSVTTFLNTAATTGCGPSYTTTAVAATDASQKQLYLIDGLRRPDDTIIYSIRVDCTPAPGQTSGGNLQRNAIFKACLDTGAACTDASTIVRAQINFADTTGTTTVQAWSVNG